MLGTFIIAALVGVCIGLLSGLLGIGGGMIMVPVFRLIFGLSAVASTATSLFTIIPTSVSGAVTHVRKGTCVPKMGIVLGVGGACLSPVGVWLAQLSPSWLVMLAVALVIIYSSFTMLRRALKGQKRSAGADADVPEAPQLSAADLAKCVAIGACAGLASGFVGLGGGFIMVPLMVSVLNMPMRLASGTSLIAVMILATPATIEQCLIGNVDYLIGIATACGSIPGAILGARLVKRVPDRTLCFIFSALLAVAAILLVVKELGLLG